MWKIVLAKWLVEKSVISYIKTQGDSLESIVAVGEKHIMEERKIAVKLAQSTILSPLYRALFETLRNNELFFRREKTD